MLRSVVAAAAAVKRRGWPESPDMWSEVASFFTGNKVPFVEMFLAVRMPPVPAAIKWHLDVGAALMSDGQKGVRKPYRVAVDKKVVPATILFKSICEWAQACILTSPTRCTTRSPVLIFVRLPNKDARAVAASCCSTKDITTYFVFAVAIWVKAYSVETGKASMSITVTAMWRDGADLSQPATWVHPHGPMYLTPSMVIALCKSKREADHTVACLHTLYPLTDGRTAGSKRVPLRAVYTTSRMVDPTKAVGVSLPEGFWDDFAQKLWTGDA